MKKFSCLLIIVFSHLVYSQLPLAENFSYIPGLLKTVSAGNWVDCYPNIPSDIRIVEGNLSYPGYASSGVGNMIFSDAVNTTSTGSMRKFTPAVRNTIYASFLLTVRDTLDLLSSSGNFLFSFLNGNIKKGFLYVIKSPNPGFIRFGFSKNAPGIFENTDRPVMTPQLIVVKYKKSTIDTVSLWINPPLTQAEPVPQIISTAGTGTDSINGIAIYRSSHSGNINIDGLRLSTQWSDAPLPVSLSSFTAKYKKDNILLEWRTETEQDNYGFDVERKIVNGSKSEQWQSIAFLPGYGNSNIPHDYKHSDVQLSGFGTYYYRLKQKDNNGGFSYSDEISLTAGIREAFSLSQNYPNPFNPGTRIRFSLEYDSEVSLSIYNILGEKVSVLLNGVKAAGDYQIDYDASKLDSGIYLCELKSGLSRKIIKMIVQK